ncbi:hypothetical protein HF086_018045 [Spodoptera exigua]|uniref:Uncharacterized protein n=1 Tax=Spodoptera exigua TaxID=7107 RepID=A0A922N2I2_SPOEX|nr:hypothetical protein HF086_018045 [Spodoptera exigua]
MGKGIESFVWSVEVELSDIDAKKECDEKSEKQDIAKPETQSPAQAEEESALKELLQVEEKYVPLITLLEKFSPGEDGILLNKKLRHFETTISSMCPEERLVQEAFATIRAAALQSPVTARKLAAVGACFNSQLQLRRVFLNVVLQETFNKLDVLERSDPRYLVNAANIMGDYFAKARLSNGKKVDFLAEPLLQYMRALLASQDIRAHRSLATQLMVNGRELMSALPQELDELTVSIRVLLLSPPTSQPNVAVTLRRPLSESIPPPTQCAAKILRLTLRVKLTKDIMIVLTYLRKQCMIKKLFKRCHVTPISGL